MNTFTAQFGTCSLENVRGALNCLDIYVFAPASQEYLLAPLAGAVRQILLVVALADAVFSSIICTAMARLPITPARWQNRAIVWKQEGREHIRQLARAAVQNMLIVLPILGARKAREWKQKAMDDRIVASREADTANHQAVLAASNKEHENQQRAALAVAEHAKATALAISEQAREEAVAALNKELAETKAGAAQATRGLKDKLADSAKALDGEMTECSVAIRRAIASAARALMVERGTRTREHERAVANVRSEQEAALAEKAKLIAAAKSEKDRALAEARKETDVEWAGKEARILDAYRKQEGVMAELRKQNEALAFDARRTEERLKEVRKAQKPRSAEQDAPTL